MDSDTILSNQDLKNIYNKMLDYLSRGDMAEKRLIKRIVRLKQRYPETVRYRNYTEENCHKVLPLLREREYIDEQRYAERVFAALRDKHDGLKAIRRKMLQRDIDIKIVDEILTSFAREHQQDLTMITLRAQKKFITLLERHAADPRKKSMVRQKLFAWLAMRGFSGEEAGEILKNIEQG